MVEDSDDIFSDAEEDERLLDLAIAFDLSLRRQLWEHTGNPLYAWAVFQTCRRTEREIPEWVMEVLDRAAFSLLVDLCDPVSGEPTCRCEHNDPKCYSPDEESDDPNRWVAMALGMAANSVGLKNPRTEFARLEKWLSLALRVSSIQREFEIGPSKAAEAVAEETGESKSSVDRACKKFAPILNAPIGSEIHAQGDSERVR